MVDPDPGAAAAGPRPVELCGIVPSLNTPFTSDGAVDLESLARLIDHLALAGAAGALANAVAGEVDSLTVDERRRMLDVVLDASAGRLTIIVGVSSPDVDASVTLAREATEAGAGAINWRAPPALGERELMDAVRRIADAGPELLVLQDLDFQGPGLAVETILALAEAEPKLRSVKIESAMPGPKISRLLTASGGRLHVMGGWPTTSMLDTLARGAHAFMPSHMIPTLVRLAELQRDGQGDLARLLAERLLPLFAFVAQHIHVSLRVGKMLRVTEGVFRTDLCRPPVTPFDQAMEAEARRLVARSLAVRDEIEALLGSGPQPGAR